MPPTPKTAAEPCGKCANHDQLIADADKHGYERAVAELAQHIATLEARIDSLQKQARVPLFEAAKQHALANHHLDRATLRAQIATLEEDYDEKLNRGDLDLILNAAERARSVARAYDTAHETGARPRTARPTPTGDRAATVYETVQ